MVAIDVLDSEEELVALVPTMLNPGICHIPHQLMHICEVGSVRHTPTAYRHTSRRKWLP